MCFPLSEWGDSNPQAHYRHKFLRLACLPIPPHSDGDFFNSCEKLVRLDSSFNWYLQVMLTLEKMFPIEKTVFGLNIKWPFNVYETLTHG